MNRDRGSVVLAAGRAAAEGLTRSVLLTLLTLWVPAILTLVLVALVGAMDSVIAAAACALALLIVSLVTLARPLSRAARALVGRWSGTPIPAGYRQSVPIARMTTGYWWNGYDYQRYRLVSVAQRWIQARIWDPASWRDMLWVLVSPIAVGSVAALPVALLIGGIIGLALPGGMTHGTPWAAAAVAALGLGLLLLPFAWRTSGPVTRGIFGSSALAQFAQLSERVTALVEGRADLTQSQDAELHRIERNLHDGPQARLVAVGLSLSAAERLIESDPAQARLLLQDARAASLAALHELRELVRGIVPPILLERGLVDAIRSLALDIPADIRVNATLDHPLETPIESALYFATAELVANAVKHAPGASIEITIDRTRDGVAITVSDDGPGGASPGGGSGLAGVRRRMDAFDGVLRIHSPRGGPTRITVEVQCASS